MIPQLARGRRRRALEEPPALFRCQPIPEAHADPPHPFDSTNTGRQFGTQETSVGRLVRDAPDGGQAKIDRGRRISALFEVNPISKHDGAVEREAGLRTVPSDEFANSVLVGSLTADGRQAVQNGRLGVFEVGILRRQSGVMP